MSTYCKLIEHNKDNKRVYKRCSVTNDKSLDSDGCTYDNEKKRCYTRKKTKQKKQGQKLTKRKAVQKKPTSIKTQIETTNKEKHLIPIDFRENIDLNIIKKYKEFSNVEPISLNYDMQELHSKLKNNYFKSKSLGTFWFNYYNK